MAEPRRDPPRGLLNLELTDPRVRLGRFVPSEPAALFVEHYWTVRWDLRDQPPFTSESLPYPSVHLVLERGQSRVHGVTTGKFRQTLREQGLVFGIKFKPGGFRPFVDAPVARLTNRKIPASRILPWADQLEAAVLAAGEDAQMADCAAVHLAPHLPVPDPQIEFVSGIVDAVAEDRSLVRVEQLVDRFGMSARHLQRLFREYVGVSPKWVIQRYRLFEASARLASGDADSVNLARELGYFDQAHFIRDFKALIGKPPGAFAAGAN
jgi:AraC-like DNA-binding protein